ncbi:MAG: AraC family transcriptional regulator [Verrucomicrobiota bacterium]
MAAPSSLARLSSPRETPGPCRLHHSGGESDAASWWAGATGGCRPLYGELHEVGFHFSWHDFRSDKTVDWLSGRNEGAVSLCLNISGTAAVGQNGTRTELGPRRLAFYYQSDPPLGSVRTANDRHQYVSIDYRPAFLREHFKDQVRDLHPLIRELVRGKSPPSQFVLVPRFGIELLDLVESLRHPPVFAPAQRVWFVSKALELAALLFFQPAQGELFCTRAKRLGRERVEKAQAILRQQMREPPGLEELGKLVGCSHFYLSRLFSQEAGMTFQQYLRSIRLERAAELLRTGRCNVTEAAFEVGYNSLSHFSAAFHDAFGCCPGLYPLRARPTGGRSV